MLAMPPQAPSRRSTLRRAVQLECAVHSPLWEGPAWYLATDVSPHGLWLTTDLALGVGERLMLCFRPPRWPEWCWPVTAFGEVVRVSLARRRADHRAAGMAVRFSEIDPVASSEMALLLKGLPPPLPRRRALESAVAVDSPRALVLDDGTCFELRAEAALLTAGRPAATTASATPAVTTAACLEPRSSSSRRRKRARKRARALGPRPRRARAKPAKLRLVG
jgi:hypothetical protein